MFQEFDKFGMAEKPSLILSNPTGEDLFSLGAAYDVDVTKAFNSLSGLEFTFPKSVDGTTELDAWDFIKSKRIIRVGSDNYIITEVEEEYDGTTPIKKVSCQSLEVELEFKKVFVFTGSYFFYDPIDTDLSLMHKIIELAPNWSIGSVDVELWTKYRSFEVSDTTLYNFIMTDVEKAFGCVFVFDTGSRTISAYTIAGATSSTDIFLSFDNLLQSGSLKEISDEVTTQLYVYGGDELDIRSVNPLGTNSIYNFDYYKNVNWMSQGLIDAIDAWEAKIYYYLNTINPTYGEILADLKIAIAELVTLEGDLVDLQTDYLAAEGVRKAQIEQGITGAAYDATTAILNGIQAEIDAKEAEIVLQEEDVDNLLIQIVAINDELDIESEDNFTTSEFEELSTYIFQNTYQNENIIKTDIMTPDEILTQSEQLYDQATEVMERISQPRYEFDVDSTNFLFLPEFDEFTDQLELGCIATIELETGVIIETVLLEITYNYDDPGDFSMKFSNRLRLDDGKFIFSDLFGQTVRTGANVSFNAGQWGNWNSNWKDSVTGFISSALDATRNALVNDLDAQEVIIDKNGLKGKYIDPDTLDYGPNEVWLTSSILAFTDDNWTTSSLALGQIDVEGTPVFGLVAGAIIGNLIAGNTLIISNENNNFRLDASGAYLNNAKFVMEAANRTQRITFDPVGTKPILIEGGNSGSYSDLLYVDGAGNLVMVGAITANSGSLGRWTIDQDGIYNSYGSDYIEVRSDGQTYVKLGALTIQPGLAKFDGTIKASSIDGYLTSGQIQSLLAEKVDCGGNMGLSSSGSGSVRWGGSSVIMGIDGTGRSVIQASNSCDIRVGLTNFEVNSGSINLFSYSNTIGQVSATNYLIGSVYTGTSKSGSARGLTTSTTTGYIMSFRNGLLIGSIAPSAPEPPNPNYLWVNGSNSMFGSLHVESDSDGLQLGEDRDITLTSSGPGDLTITPATDTDLAVTFAGTTNSGVVRWKEDENYFDINKGIHVNTVNITGSVTTTTSLGYAEMYMYDNTTAVVIDITNLYHAVHNTFGNNDGTLAPLRDTTYWTYKAGATYTIASVATFAGGKIQCTVTAGHSLLAGEPITITGSLIAGYDGTYLVHADGLTATKFVVDVAYSATSVASARKPATLKCLIAGNFEASFNVSGTVGSPNDNVKVELNRNTTMLDNICARGLWDNTKYSSMGGSGLVSMAVGEYIWMSAKNYSSTANITFYSANVALHRIL